MNPVLRSTHPTLRNPSVKTPPQKISTRILAGSVAALLAFQSLPEAKAASYYWDTTTTGLWATGANWSDNPASGGTTGFVPGTGDTVVFNQSSVNGNETVQLNAATSIAGMTFNNTGTTLIASDSATPQTLTLGNSGITMASTAGAVTIGSFTNPVSIRFANNTTAETWKNNSTTQALTIVGNISTQALSGTAGTNGFNASGVSTASFPNAPGVILKNGTGFSRMNGNTGIIDGGGTLTLDNYSLTIGNSNSNANNGIGASGTANNTFTLINGSFFDSSNGNLTAPPADNGGAAFTVGGGTSGNQVLNVLSGSTFRAARRFSVAVNITNKVNVDGANSVFLQGGQVNNTSGGTWKVSNGGEAHFGGQLNGMLTQINNSNNFVMSVTGTDPTTGAAAVVVTPGIILPNAGNTITVGTVGGIGSGGFLQLIAPAPTITLTGSVTINNGGLSYGFLNSALVLGLTTYSGDLLTTNQGGAGTPGAFTWLGSNRFRLNGSTVGVTDNGVAAYTFANNLGVKNYYAMEFLGTASITSRDVTFDGANGAEMLFKGATATVTGATKVQGGQVIVKADGSASTFTGVISDGASSGGLTITSSTVSSASTLTLLSANTYTGPTNINRGTLALGASGSINSSSTIAISGGATYNVSAVSGYALAGSQILSAPSTGTATVIGAINAGANTITLQDATNIGILAFNNDLTLNGGTLRFDLGSSNTADRITLLGSPTLSGSNTINVAGLTGLTSLSVGDYTLMTATGGLGTTFTLASSTLTIGSHTYNLSLSSSTATAEILTLTAAGGGATSGQYTLATVVTGATLLHANGGTTTLSTTIQNTGAIPQDTLIFSALTATAGSGTVGAASGTTSGLDLALGASSSPAATQTYTAGATLGAVAISNSATVTNSTVVGSPVATNTGTAVTVYSGLSTWTGASGGSWGTLISGFGTNWDVNQGSPGVDTSFATTDTATFGNTAGTVTVNLNGANPSLNALTLNSTGSSTLAQGSSGGLTLAGASGASITAAGTQAISAPLTLATTATVSVTGGADLLTISGAIGETGGAQALIKTGSGTLVLSGANQFTGAVLLASGTLVATNPTALGTSAGGTTVISGATLDVQANLGTEAISLSGSGVGGLGALRTSTGTGTVGGVVTLTGSSTINVASGSKLNLNGGITTSGSQNLQKTIGTGILNLNGNFDATGPTTSYIQSFSGAINLSNSIAHVGILEVSGQGSSPDATLNINHSTVEVDGVNELGWMIIGNSGYATSTMSINNSTVTTFWGGPRMNDSGNNHQKSLLVVENGGILNLNDGAGNGSFLAMGDGGTAPSALGSSQVIVRSGTINVNGSASIQIGIQDGENAFNQLGGNVNIPQDNSTSANGTPGALDMQYRMNRLPYCLYNLNGGTLFAGNVQTGDGTANTNGINNSFFNFHGGTLKTAANDGNFFKTTITGLSAAQALASAPNALVWSEGAVIDTDGKNVTIQVPLIAPSGSGVYVDGSRNLTIALTGNDRGSGYQGAAVVRIGTTKGTATAVADMEDDGTGNGTFRIASITITNPGINFVSAPSVFITGGNPTLAATAPALTTATNLSGGLTKNGLGTLTLSGANTYTGNTLVNTGTLALGNLNALQFSTLDTGISGAQAVTFTVAGTNTYNLGGLQGADALNAGSNSLSIGANNANTTSTGDLTAAAITKVGTGTLDLNGANQSSNSLTANAGTTNLNGALVTLTADVAVNNLGTKLRFGSVSQTLNSLTIGNGATVTFTSGAASGAFSGGGKFTGVSAVPEPGSLGLLLVGAIGVVSRRRRRP